MPSSHSCTKLPPDIPTLQVRTEGLKSWVSLLLSPHKSTPSGTWPWEELHWPGSCQKSSFRNHWIRDWDGGNSHQYSIVCYSWPSEHGIAAPALSTTGISALFPLSLHQDLVKVTPEGEHSNRIPFTPKVGARSSWSTSWENKKGKKKPKRKSTFTNTAFCDFIKRCFQDRQASGCRCYKPYNEKQNTQWAGGKLFSITIILSQTKNKPSCPIELHSSFPAFWQMIPIFSTEGGLARHLSKISNWNYFLTKAAYKLFSPGF